MSDNFQFIDVDDDDFFDAPKALRDHVKKLQERLTDREDKLTEVTKTLHQRTVNDVLADKGFKNPKRVQRDLLADKVDPLDERAVSKWLEENADDYAKAEQKAESGTESQTQETEQSTVTPETQNGYEAMQQTVQGAPPAGHDKYAAAHAEIDNNPQWTSDEVRKFLVSKGL